MYYFCISSIHVSAILILKSKDRGVWQEQFLLYRVIENWLFIKCIAFKCYLVTFNPQMTFSKVIEQYEP